MLAALLVLLHGWWAYSATREMSATYDEPLHVTAGVSYWRYDDYRLQPENGNLPQRIAALGVLARGDSAPRVAGLEDAWRTSDAPRLVDAYFYDAGRDPQAILAGARRAALVWTLLAAVLVFGWARHLWGDAGGLFALLLYSVSTTTLAHGALATSDMSAAVTFTAAIAAWWSFLERPSPRGLLLSAAVTSLAFLAKFSAVLLPIAFVATLAWRHAWYGAPLRVDGSSRRPPQALGLYAVATLVHVAAVWLAVWMAFGWRYSPIGDDMPAMAQYYRLWSFTLPPDGLLRAVLDRAREWQLLPEAYIHGFSYVQAAAQNRGAFLNGEFRSTGWWWFFPYAFVVKSSLAELAVWGSTLALAATGWWRLRVGGQQAEWRARLRPLLPLLVWIAVYVAVSVTSRLNIGHRHLLPIYPALFVLAGALVGSQATRRRQLAAAGLALLAVGESLQARPFYLASFNALAGGSANGWRHLIDSSLDWGQEAPRTAAWLRANAAPDEPVFYSLFGLRRAARYGIVGTEIAPEYSLGPRPWAAWTSGLYVISATQLQDVYSPAAGPWSAARERDYQWLAARMRAQLEDGSRAPLIDPADAWGENLQTLERLQFARLVNYLRLRTPDAVIGHSVFVHRLSAADVAALTGGTEAYVALLDRSAAGARRP